ncbi:aquaporin [Phaeovulum sp.]|uniref:aquaporin n=1 Tax=Phaeovulum sp. TaxID=2934796 RepID=UPI0039E3E880
MLKNLTSEALGTAVLSATVFGASQAAAPLGLVGNIPVSLVAGFALFILITIFTPISGGHLNPLITLYFYTRQTVSAWVGLAYVAAQVLGAVLGALVAHAMFGLPLLQLSEIERNAPGLGIAEVVAGFGFVLMVSGGLRANAALVPALVGAFATCAVWFTSSGGFANPAVMVGRMLTATPGGVAPDSFPMLVAAQFIGALIAVGVGRYLFDTPAPSEGSAVYSCENKD